VKKKLIDVKETFSAHPTKSSDPVNWHEIRPIGTKRHTRHLCPSVARKNDSGPVLIPVSGLISRISPFSNPSRRELRFPRLGIPRQPVPSLYPTVKQRCFLTFVSIVFCLFIICYLFLFSTFYDFFCNSYKSKHDPFSKSHCIFSFLIFITLPSLAPKEEKRMSISQQKQVSEYNNQ
jgi:hypothetical protein